MKVGDIRVIRQIAQWRECEGCGKPAKYRLTFLLQDFRSNPASKAFGRDDCSWISDLDIYSCENCKHTLSQSPHGYNSGCGCFPLIKFKHMGFYWITQPKSENNLGEYEPKSDESKLPTPSEMRGMAPDFTGELNESGLMTEAECQVRVEKIRQEIMKIDCMEDVTDVREAITNLVYTLKKQ